MSVKTSKRVLQKEKTASGVHSLVGAAIHEAIGARMDVAARNAFLQKTRFDPSNWHDETAEQLAKGLLGVKNEEVVHALLAKVALLDDDLSRLNAVRKSFSSKGRGLDAGLERTARLIREKIAHRRILLAAAGVKEVEKKR